MNNNTPSLPLATDRNLWDSWILEVSRHFGEDELSEEGKKEFRNYFDQGLSPSEAIYHDRRIETECVAKKVVVARNLVDTAPFDEIQRLVLQSYEKGEFAHLAPQEVVDCGDGLLKFLLVELSQQEDCENFEVAVNRVETAIRQLQDLRIDLANAYLNPASPAYKGKLKPQNPSSDTSPTM